jgi:hypothetical protein
MVKLYEISSEKFTYIVYIFIVIFGSTFYPCRCQLIRFDQYFQGSTGLPEGYDIKIFHLIEVSTSFEGAFVHFRLCDLYFHFGHHNARCLSISVCTTSSILWL